MVAFIIFIVVFGLAVMVSEGDPGAIRFVETVGAILLLVIICYIWLRIDKKREAKKESERARLESLKREEQHENAERALTQKYQNSPIIDEVIALFKVELGGYIPQRIIVNREYVQATLESKTATYYFLSHGLDPLPEKCGAPDDPYNEQYYPVELFADSINLRLGNRYHVEKRDYNMKNVAAFNSTSFQIPAHQECNGINEVVLRINATRQF